MDSFAGCGMETVTGCALREPCMGFGRFICAIAGKLMTEMTDRLASVSIAIPARVEWIVFTGISSRKIENRQHSRSQMLRVRCKDK